MHGLCFFLQSLDTPLINLNLDLDRTVLPSGQSEKAIIKVLLDVPQIADSSQRPPVNLTLILDRSGSMSGHKLQKAKEAAIAALHRLSERDLFSLVVYDHNVNTLVLPLQVGHFCMPINIDTSAFSKHNAPTWI